MRRRAVRLGLAVPLVALTGLVVISDPSASGSAARTPHLSGASFSETWTTGQLPDAGGPIALSSPVPVSLGGQPSMVVGDRHGNLFAFHLGGSSATAPPGWPTTNESGPIDSTPSISDSGGRTSVLVGSGNDADPGPGGYSAFGPTGSQLWFTQVVNPPSDTAPAGGVEAGLAVGSLQSGGSDAVAGSLGQVSYALDASSGTPLTGWPFLNTDSTHSTA
ncbi:MAG TPA: hypothetical protein VII46_06875, partial [Acidimicrobiales bacterium]